MKKCEKSLTELLLKEKLPKLPYFYPKLSNLSKKIALRVRVIQSLCALAFVTKISAETECTITTFLLLFHILQLFRKYSRSDKMTSFRSEEFICIFIPNQIICTLNTFSRCVWFEKFEKSKDQNELVAR